MRWLWLISVLVMACRSSTPLAPTPSAAWASPLEGVEKGRPSLQVLVDGQVRRLLLDTTASASSLFDGAHSTLTARGDELALRGVQTVARPAAVPETELDGVLALSDIAQQGAIVLDFEGQRVVTVTGRLNRWLMWLDERCPQGRVESLVLPNPRGAPSVKLSVGDRQDVVTLIASARPGTAFVRSLFDASLLTGDRLTGVQLSAGATEFGTLDVGLEASLGEGVQGALGMDVLRSRVLLVPAGPHQAIWLLTPP